MLVIRISTRFFSSAANSTFRFGSITLGIRAIFGLFRRPGITTSVNNRSISPPPLITARALVASGTCNTW